MQPKKYRCPICNTKWENYKRLGMHIVFFHGDRKDECPEYLKGCERDKNAEM